MIYKKMIAIMGDLKAIGKDQYNTHQKFAFRGIDQFINALHPLLVKHEVFITLNTGSHNEEVREVTRRTGDKGWDKHASLTVTYTFTTIDGSSVSSTVPGEAIDSGDKATSKALAMAFKYCLIQTFCVPTLDMEDPDSLSPTIGDVKKAPVVSQPYTPPPVATTTSKPSKGGNAISEKQLFRLYAKAGKKWSKGGIDQWLQSTYGIPSAAQVGWKDYEEIVAYLENNDELSPSSAALSSNLPPHLEQPPLFNEDDIPF